MALALQRVLTGEHSSGTTFWQTRELGEHMDQGETLVLRDLPQGGGSGGCVLVALSAV